MIGTNPVSMMQMLTNDESQRHGPLLNPPRPMGLRILLADNSPVFCRALRATLIRETPANAVEIVSSLDDLEPALRQFRPRLVLLDLGLGSHLNVSGRQVLESLVRQPRRAKVIVLTEDPAPQMTSYVMAAGAFAQFDKALESAELVRTISHMARLEAA